MWASAHMYFCDLTTLLSFCDACMVYVFPLLPVHSVADSSITQLSWDSLKFRCINLLTDYDFGQKYLNNWIIYNFKIVQKIDGRGFVGRYL